MELSEEFILELTQVQQRFFGFLFKWLADREQAREVLQRTNLVLCRKSSARNKFQGLGDEPSKQDA